MIARMIILLASAGVLLPVGCIPQVGDTADEQTSTDLLASDDSNAVAGDPNTADEEDRRRVAAWLAYDSDNDGLTNELELEYGLDPEDPTDGPDIDGDGLINCVDDDIDGDGVPNESDPDIDGDSVSNSDDYDTDGDAIPDSVDFDTDSDSIRDRWDNDDDGDDEDDDDDDDDEDEGAQADDNDNGGVDDGGGDADNGDDDDDDEELREKYIKMAQWIEDVFGDHDDDDDDDPELHAEGLLAQAGDSTPEPEITKFAVHVEALSERARNGDTDAKRQLRRLLLAIDAGLLMPIDPESDEARKLARQLAERLGYGDVTTADMLEYVSRLQDISKIEPDDASEAYDVLVKQVNEVEDSGTRDPKSEIEDRLDNIERIAGEFEELGATDAAQAITDMARILREISLDDKIDSLLDLRDAVEDPEVGNLVDGIEWLANNIEGIETEQNLDEVISVLKSVPGVSDGIDQEDLEEAEELIEGEDDPDPEPA